MPRGKGTIQTTPRTKSRKFCCMDLVSYGFIYVNRLLTTTKTLNLLLHSKTEIHSAEERKGRKPTQKDSVGRKRGKTFFLSFKISNPRLTACWLLVFEDMGDHFALLVDRLLTESTLEAAIESRNPGKRSAALGTDITKIDCSSHDIDIKDISSPRKMVECKICQDEDEVSNMETPCCCCGSLKYAHRRCVQRWCDEKGDTLCEICQQPFEPGYTAPPPMFQFGSVPMNFRGNWEIARRDVNNTRFIAMVSTDRNFLDPDNDEYTVSASRNLFHCRSVAIIFMVLLILRHVLPIVIDGTQDLSLPLLLLLALRTCGVVLPIYIVARAVNAIHCRQRHQQQQHQGSGSETSSSSSSDEESGLLPTPHHRHHYHHPQLISIH